MTLSTTASRASAWHVTVLAMGPAVGGFLFGFDTSTMNSALNGVRETLGLRTGAVAFVAAISLVGGAIGAWFAGPLSAKVGRTRVMSIAGGVIAAGSLGVALTSVVSLVGLSRVTAGLGIGAARAVVPAYIAEIAPSRIRGRLGSLWQLAIIVGQVVGLLADYGLPRWAGSEAHPMPWADPHGDGCSASWPQSAVTYVLVARTLPASPPDLVRHRRVQEAEAFMARIVGCSAVTEEVRAIERMQSEKEAGRLRDLRGNRRGLRPIVWTGIFLATFQQLVGINVVKTYSNTLWSRVGFSTHATFASAL